MRYLLPFVLFLLYSCASVTPFAKVPPEDLTWQSVIEVDNVSGDDLYTECHTWLFRLFRSPKSVIQFADRDAGRIMANYIFRFREGYATYVARTTIIIDTQDERVRIRFVDPYYQTSRATTLAEVTYTDWEPVVNTLIKKYHTEWQAMESALFETLSEYKSDW